MGLTKVLGSANADIQAWRLDCIDVINASITGSKFSSLPYPLLRDDDSLDDLMSSL